MITLNATGDSVDLAERIPAISSRGYIAAQVVAPPSGGVAIFDSAGRLVQTITRAGGGPGELRDVTGVGFGRGDTLWIIDAPFSMHAYSPPPASSYVRTVHTKHLITGAVYPFGLLTPAMFRSVSASSAGMQALPPTLTDWNGRDVAHFEGTAVGHGAMGPIVAVDSSRIWRIALDRYFIEEISSDGATKRQFSREVDWFPSEGPASGLPWTTRPRTTASPITVDSAGHVWVLIRRAHRNWKPDPKGPPLNPGPIRPASLPGFGYSSQFYEMVLEVFDTTSGVAIASKELAGTVVGFAAPGVLCEITETPEGFPVVRLLAVTLGQASGR